MQQLRLDPKWARFCGAKAEKALCTALGGSGHTDRRIQSDEMDTRKLSDDSPE